MKVRTRFLAFVVSFLGLLFLRHPAQIAHPQFWGEDGNFFTDAYELGVRSFGYPCAGYLHFVSRLVALVASLFSPLWAPDFFVGFCVLFSLLAAWIVFDNRWQLPPAAKFAMGLSVVAVPSNGEIFLNLTNLHWILVLALATLVLQPPSPCASRRWAEAGVVLLFGFSGVGGVVLFPFAAVLMWIERDPRRWPMLMALTAAVLGQLGTMAFAPRVTMAAKLPLRRWVSVIEPLGASLVRGLVPKSAVIPSFIALVLCLTLLTFLWRGLAERAEKVSLRALLIFALGMFLAACYRRQSEIAGISAFGNGGRYFYIPYFAIFVGLIALFRHPWARVVLAIALVNSLSHYPSFAYDDLDWKHDLRSACAGSGGGAVWINPRHADVPWSVRVSPKICGAL